MSCNTEKAMTESSQDIIGEVVPPSHPFGVQLSPDRGERSRASSYVWKEIEEKAKKINEDKAVKNKQRSETQRKVSLFNTTPDRRACYRLCVGMVATVLCIGCVVGLVWNMLKIDNLSREIRGLLKTESDIKDLLLRIQNMDLNDKLLDEELGVSEQMLHNLTSRNPFDRNAYGSTTTTTAKPMTVPTKTTTNLPQVSSTEQTVGTHVSQIPNTSFCVLQTAHVTHATYDFLAVRVKVPSDGLSSSENWCRDYQYLCAHFSRRPTGCASAHYNSTSPFRECRDEYDSDMTISGALGCNPSSGIGTAVGQAFPEAETSGNTFGFFQCGHNYCQKNIEANGKSLAYMQGFLDDKDTIMYTLCR